MGRPKYLSPSSFNPKYNQWQLFKTVIDTTDAESDYIAFNFWEACNVNAGRINAYICRPMVEEGDTYYGWTLSDEDNDYVGANLIDNSRTFQVGGNILSVTGNKTLVGDVYELTASGMYTHNDVRCLNHRSGIDKICHRACKSDEDRIGIYHFFQPFSFEEKYKW